MSAAYLYEVLQSLEYRVTAVSNVQAARARRRSGTS